MTTTSAPPQATNPAATAISSPVLVDDTHLLDDASAALVHRLPVTGVPAPASLAGPLALGDGWPGLSQ